MSISVCALSFLLIGKELVNPFLKNRFRNAIPIPWYDVGHMAKPYMHPGTKGAISRPKIVNSFLLCLFFSQKRVRSLLLQLRKGSTAMPCDMIQNFYFSKFDRTNLQGTSFTDHKYIFFVVFSLSFQLWCCNNKQHSNRVWFSFVKAKASILLGYQCPAGRDSTWFPNSLKEVCK